MRKWIAVVLLSVGLYGSAWAQRGNMSTVDADYMHDFCGAFLSATASGAGESYKDRKELVFSTRCWNYVSAVMDESAGAHWDTSRDGGSPVVREWKWTAPAGDVIKAFMVWIEKNPDHLHDPANIAIKESAVAAKFYVPE